MMKYGKHIGHPKRRNAVAMLGYTLLICVVLSVVYLLLWGLGVIE